MTYYCRSVLLAAVLYVAAMVSDQHQSMTLADDTAAGQSTPKKLATSKKLEGYDLTFPSMGSSMTISAYAESETMVESAFTDVRTEVDRLVAIMSDYDPRSELNQLYDPPSQSKHLSNELFEVLQASDRWHRETDGAFDVAIGRLTRLWRTARREQKIPDASAIQEAVAHSSWVSVELNQTDRTIRLIDPVVRIDLGGIAAGYIVDRAFDILLKHKLPHCLINAGGDIRCGLAPPGREGWKVEVASIVRNGPPLRRIYLSNAAITTSGDLWQYIEIDGQRRSHIIDPKTGYGVHGPLTVSVIAPTCIEADVAATAVCVMGKSQGMKWVTEKKRYEALWLSSASQDELSDDAPLECIETDGFPTAIPSEQSKGQSVEQPNR